VALSGHAAAAIVKKLAERAGLDPVEFSGTACAPELRLMLLS
jgi:hypothetical protein